MSNGIYQQEAQVCSVPGTTLLEMWCDNDTVNWCERSATGVIPLSSVMFSPVINEV